MMNRLVATRCGRVYRRLLQVSLLCLVSSCNVLQNVNVFSLDQDRDLGTQTYEEILTDHSLVTGGAAHEMVNRLMNRLVAAARVEYPGIVDHFEWQVELIHDDGTVNAFALPGGKMAVYTGIIPIAQTENGLAVVMGHEIAHVIERHGTEAMTRAVGAQAIIEILLEGNKKDVAHLGAGLLSLQFGRSAEMEADAMGLRFMARAGYDPRVAVDFWTRMSALGGSGDPEWLSTHPSHDRRIDQIKELLPSVLPIYEANRAK